MKTENIDGSNAIVVHDLSKNYGKDIGIKNVSFEVKTGEIFGFIGPNGAGKSTAIRTILGLLQANGGSAEILGLDALTQGDQLRQQIGYLPSEVHYYNEMNSRELLEYSAGFYENVNLSLIDELADYYDLDLKKKIADLSFGNKKKCAIIQSVLHEPSVLILDEPTSGLDPLMQNRFFDMLEKENKKGVTIFFSSHILSEIQRMCSRAAVIRNGEIVAVENIQTLLEKQMKKVRVVFARETNYNLPAGAQHEKSNGNKLSFEYVGKVNTLLSWLASHELHDAVLEEPDLESIFMNYYER